jgi:hypothetical protein
LLNFDLVGVLQNLARMLNLFMGARHRHQKVSGLQQCLILQRFFPVHAKGHQATDQYAHAGSTDASDNQAAQSLR